MRILLLLITGATLFGSALKAQTATSLTVSDTRSADSLPSFYKKTARFDFKQRAAIHAPGTGMYNGLLTLAPWFDASGGPVYQMSFDPAGIYLRQGSFSTNSWGAWSRLLIESSTGLTSLGNGSSTSGLNVNGNIKAREVKVTTAAADWPDYVFDQGYKLLPAGELAARIRKEGHLPDMPPASEVQKEGISVGHLLKLQQQKIEELTLYMIEQQKQIDTLSRLTRELQNKLSDEKN